MSLLSAWQALVDLQSRRNQRPLRTAAREDRDARAKQRGVIERSGIDRKAVVRADGSTEHQPAADGTEVAHRIPAAGRLAGELPRRAAEPHGVTPEAQEGDESRARDLAAIGAVAVPRHGRFTLGLVAQRATQAPAGVSGLGVAHRPIILAAPVPGKLV